MKKILFLENKYYYDLLGFNKIYYLYNCEFEGIKNYKIKNKELKKYNAIISLLYQNSISNFIILKAKRLGIKTILLSDGIYDFANSYKNPDRKKYNLNLFDPIFHDYFLCIGRKEKKMLENSFNQVEQYLPKRILDTHHERILLAEKGKVLITTANTPYFNEIEKKELVELLKRIILSLENLNIKYIFRIFDLNLINELNILDSNNLKEGSFESVLKDIEYVITTPSSISLTSMFHQRAVAHLIYRDTPILIQSGWNISKSYPIEKTLVSFINKDKERIDFQNKILKNYIVDKEADDILSKIIEKKFEQKKEEFIITNLENMLNSIFNFNIEYFFRKIYLKIKNIKIVKSIKQKIK